MSDETAESTINSIFSNLDRWRHLPSYQLERRADIFFSLYLIEVLQEKLKTEMCLEVIPEFPLNAAVLGLDVKWKIPGERSFKVDYFVISGDRKAAFLIELKTDAASHNKKQAEYLYRAREASFTTLLAGLKKSFAKSNAKRKYFQLLLSLERLGLVGISDSLKDIMRRGTLKGATDAISEITTEQAESVEIRKIVIIQPKVDPKPEKPIDDAIVITFDDFIAVARKKNDWVSKRFVESLERWKDTEAGKPA